MSAMHEPLVTVVIATHNRPQTLCSAIQSVQRQTLSDWRVLVMGDGCDHRTGELVREFKDERIRYVHLPEWFGEQSGPNSIGMTLADTEYVSFLNQDDVFIQDHLEHAIKTLKDTSSDLIITRAAIANRLTSPGSSAQRPRFDRVSPLDRRLDHLYWGDYRLWEPCSSWVFRRSVVDRVGLWCPARQSYRVPLQDWLLRVWRSKVPVRVDNLLTVLRAHIQGDDPSQAELARYDREMPGHQVMDKWLDRAEASTVRETVLRDCSESIEDRSLGVKTSRFSVIKRLAALLYRICGVDGYAIWQRILGRRPGAWAYQAAVRRTGRQLPAYPDVNETLANVRRSMNVSG